MHSAVVAKSMFMSLWNLKSIDDEFIMRLDELGYAPHETLLDWGLITLANGGNYHENVALIHHIESRGFSMVHNILFRVHPAGPSLSTYLGSSTAQELAATIDICDSHCRTPLGWAVEFGMTQAATVLLRFGADPSQLRTNPTRGFSPLLHVAITGIGCDSMPNSLVEIVKLLLQYDADPNGTDHEGWTPLHIAASWNSFVVTDLLIDLVGQRLDWKKLTTSSESILDLAEDEYRNRYNGYVIVNASSSYSQ